MTHPSSDPVVTVRDLQSADLNQLHAINEAAVPGVNSLDYPEFESLLNSGSDLVRVALVSGRIAGFVSCMQEGRAYESVNYRWISARYKSFSYVDRVVIDASQRGAGLGAKLYGSIFDTWSQTHDVLLAEVNLEPPNPGSQRFHERMGFKPVGERWNDDATKGVIYLEKSLRSHQPTPSA